MEKAVHTFDVEFFIEEIRNRPAIWDCSSDEYSDKVKKQQCWNEIFCIAYKDYEEMSREKKIAVAKELCNKWKNLRQCFKRELDKRKQTKSGSGRSGQKGYIYFDILSFLTPVVSSKQTVSSLDVELGDEEDGPDASERSHNIPTKDIPVHRVGSKRKLSDSDRVGELCDVLRDSLAQKKDTQKDVDDDTHFVLSLVPSMNSVPKTMKLQLRADMIQLVAKYCNSSVVPPQLPPFPIPQPYPPPYLSVPYTNYQKTPFPPQYTTFPELSTIQKLYLAAHNNNFPKSTAPSQTALHERASHSPMSSVGNNTDESSMLDFSEII